MACLRRYFKDEYYRGYKIESYKKHGMVYTRIIGLRCPNTGITGILSTAKFRTKEDGLEWAKFFIDNYG